MAPVDPSVYAVIMAGGGGTRFWPLSRQRKPKQFLSIAGEQSLLQTTWDRALEIVSGPENVIVVTANDYESMTIGQIPDLLQENLLLEPQARNTAPCIAWATAAIRDRDADAVEVVMPSDHLITDVQAFRSAVATAVDASREHGALATFGVSPRYPETGYGYIEAGTTLSSTDDSSIEVFRVENFREKPDFETAEGYVTAGNYYWNSGIFVWTAAEIWRSLEEHLPKVCSAGKRMVKEVDPEARAVTYAEMPAISIDFGVMERAENVVIVRADFDWSDVGSWAALHEVSVKSEGDNVAFGEIVQIDSTGNLVHAPDTRVVMLGVDNLAVVHTGDVVLVASLERSQDVKLLRERLEVLGLDHLL